MEAVGRITAIRAFPPRWSMLVPAAVLLALAGGRVAEDARHRTHGVGSPPVLSWVLFALAAVALVASLAHPAALRLAPAPKLRSALRVRRGSIESYAVALSFFSAAASVPLFMRLNRSDTAAEAGWAANNLSWLLYIASLVSFAVGITLVSRRTGVQQRRTDAIGWPPVLARRIELPIVAALGGAALAIRLTDLQTIPHGLWFDEAQNGLVAEQLVSHGGLHSVFVTDLTQMGVLALYPLGVALHVFGPAIWVLRLLPAVAGSLTVPLLYLLASRLYGWRVGVAASALLAVSSWSVTFSRFGMESMVTVAFDVAVYFCVVMGLRSGRLTWYAAGGILLGLGMQGYYVGRLVPVVLLGLLLYLTARGRREVWQARAGLAVFTVAAVLAFLPMGVFAVQRTSDYQARTTTVSIFSTEGRAGQSDALWQSLRKHALMFNFHGDDNARHNLPNSAMLDWLAAATFFAGLGVCLLRVRRWEYFFPLLWFAAALSGGVFSLLGEAPQAHRTLEASVVTCLLAGVFIGESWRAVAPARRELRRVAHGAAALAVVAVIAAVAVMDLDKYFGPQAENSAVWREMGADKLALGRLARAHAADELWISDDLADQPALRFLAPMATPVAWTGESLPFADPEGRDVVVLLDPSRWVNMAAIAELYPHARFEVFRAPDRSPLLYALVVPAADVAASHGAVRFYADGRSKRSPAFAVGGLPLPQRIIATIRAPAYARYRFAWHGRGGASAGIRVDGRDLPRGRTRRLAEGLHTVELTPTRAGAGELLWSIAGAPYRPLDRDALFDPRTVRPLGLEGLYRSQAVEGTQFARIDRVVGTNFHQLPVPPPFSVDWRGRLYAPTAGRYLLGTVQVATARILLDGRQILHNTDQNVLHEVPVNLTRGWHQLRIAYEASGGNFEAFLYWMPPGRPRSVVPSAYLRPPTSTPLFERFPSLAASDGNLRPGRLIEAGEP